MADACAIFEQKKNCAFTQCPPSAVAMSPLFLICFNLNSNFSLALCLWVSHVASASQMLSVVACLTHGKV